MSRIYDLSAFKGAGFDSYRLTTQSVFGVADPGELCTGKQKLAQQWLLEFLTERGSMGFHLATVGTNFLTRLRQRQLLNDHDVRVEFNFAELQIRQTFLATVTASTPLDETLVEATLEGVELSDTAISLTIRLTTAAGENVAFVTPISIAPASFN